MREAFLKRFPDVDLITVVDDSMPGEVQANGNAITPGIVRRLVSFASNVQMQGASVAVCMCTTVADAVHIAAKAVDIPFVTIDAPLMDTAVRAGEKTALLVTAKTTVEISGNSARSAARAAGRENITIDTILVPGAFEALNVEKDKARHDALIAACARNAAKDYDVVALAQISMADAAALVGEVGVPVLTSVASGLEQLAPYLV